MGRRLERGAVCLLNLDPGQNTPSLYIQGTCTSHTYHLTIRLRRVHGVVRVTPLGELYSRNNQQAPKLHYHDIMRHIELLTDDQEFR